jgi:hypothetical protein
MINHKATLMVLLSSGVMQIISPHHLASRGRMIAQIASQSIRRAFYLEAIENHDGN